MKILFINGSPNKNGNTKALADVLLNGREYETLNLTDYKIYSYGQNFEEDQLGTVIAKMKEADVIVIGSPLYWHNICGAVRNVLDRFYGLVSESELAGKDMYFLFLSPIFFYYIDVFLPFNINMHIYIINIINLINMQCKKYFLLYKY